MQTPTRRIVPPLAALALALGALTACSANDSAEFDPADPGQDVEASEETSPEEGTGRPDDSDDTEGTQDEAPDAGGEVSGGNPHVRGPEEAVDRVTYEVPDYNLEVTVGLQTLRVEGDVMLLELSFTPEGGTGGSYTIFRLGRNELMQPVLNDRENLKQYRILRSRGQLWNSDSTTSIQSGETIMFYAYYAAPQDDIATINITVLDGLVEFTDAPIQW